MKEQEFRIVLEVRIKDHPTEVFEYLEMFSCSKECTPCVFYRK